MKWDFVGDWGENGERENEKRKNGKRKGKGKTENGKEIREKRIIRKKWFLWVRAVWNLGRGNEEGFMGGGVIFEEIRYRYRWN